MYRNCRGFTLMEVILALGLLAGGVCATTVIFSKGMYAQTDSENVTQATALAHEKLEQLRGGPFAAIVNEPKTAVTGWPGFSRQVVVTQPSGTNAQLKQVVVTVYWNSNGGEVSTSLTTYVASLAN